VRDFVARNGDAAGWGRRGRRANSAAWSCRSRWGHKPDKIAFIDVEIQALQYLNFLAAARYVLSRRGLESRRSISTAVHSDHCVLSLATPAFVRRAKLFSDLYGLTVAQVCRRLGYDGVPDRHTRDDFPIGTAIAPRVTARARLVVFQQEDMLLPFSSCTALAGIRMATASEPGFGFCSAPRKLL